MRDYSKERKMNQPDIIIGVTDGKAELIYNRKNIDYLILDFELLDEYGTRQEQEHVDRLVNSHRFNEACEYLADLEPELDERMWEVS